MKKSKLSIGLVTSFIAATALTACNEVTKNSKNLVTFKGYDGEERAVVTDEFYKEYLNGTKSISDLYDKVLEVMIRYEFGRDHTEDRNKGVPYVNEKKSLETIQAEAANDVLDKKQEAKDNAKANNTKYEKEWESILNSYNCKKEADLKEHFIYEREKDVIEDWFFDQNEASLTNEWLGIGFDGEENETPLLSSIANSKLPYHIRHILVNSSEGSDIVKETIDQTTAENLFKVFKKLSNGNETFGQIALENSDDGSKTSYGDVGIMDNTCSVSGSFQMVPEFQLAVYSYDAILSRADAKRNSSINTALGITDSVAESLKTLSDNANEAIEGLTEVPYSVFEDLNTYAKVVTDPNGFSLAEGNTAIYPRNILWNKYLNHHNPFIITNRSRLDVSALGLFANAKLANEQAPNNELYEGFDTTVTEAGDGQTGFRYAKDLKGLEDLELPDDMMVLTDENANPIIGVRSEFGIHFIVLQKSIYDFGDTVSLHDYYSTKLPKDYTKENGLLDENGKAKQTYVNYLANQETSEYQTRSDAIKNAVKSFDSTYDYRLYDYLLGKLGENVTFYNKTDEKINSYIANKRENNKYNQEQGLILAWRNYLEQINQQNVLRKTTWTVGEVEHSRLVPEGCVVGFVVSGHGAEDYQKGGICYYGK